MNTSTRRKQVLTIYLGGAFLLAMVASGWLPTSCPLLRQAFSSCPKQGYSLESLPPEQREIERVPHAVIEKPLAEFAVKSQDYRETTDVKFSYKGDLSHQVSYLGIKSNGMLTRMSLVTHPLLVNLTWPRYSMVLPNQTMYQRNERYSDISALRASLPPANEFAVDRTIASQWKLESSQYTLLEDLKSLDGINYIATTYSPPIQDGTWRNYSQTFNIQDSTPDAQGNINWFIELPDVTGGSEPFRLTTVHIDYRALR